MEALHPIASGLSTFVLVFLAEFGDKSQLACMLLASRYRAMPVLLGAIAAFALLNMMAVVLGAAAAKWIPEELLMIFVIGFFLVFGLKGLLQKGDDNLEEEKTSHSIFVTAFVMIFLAEFGDKTQLTVAALASQSDPIDTYSGAMLALTASSVIGVMGGRILSSRLSTTVLHRLSGVLFLAFAFWLSYLLFQGP